MELADKLLAFLKKNGAQHEDKCLEHLFNKPEYNRDNPRSYHEWQSKAYGNEGRYMRGELEITIHGTPYNETYAHQLHLAYQELRAKGLADEINNGYNSYTFYAK